MNLKYAKALRRAAKMIAIDNQGSAALTTRYITGRPVRSNRTGTRTVDPNCARGIYLRMKRDHNTNPRRRTA